MRTTLYLLATTTQSEQGHPVLCFPESLPLSQSLFYVRPLSLLPTCLSEYPVTERGLLCKPLSCWILFAFDERERLAELAPPFYFETLPPCPCEERGEAVMWHHNVM